MEESPSVWRRGCFRNPILVLVDAIRTRPTSSRSNRLRESSAERTPTTNRLKCFPTTALCTCVQSSSAENGINEQCSSATLCHTTSGRLYHFDAPYRPITAHTQVEFVHYLIPDLYEITWSSYYWGTMNRFEADALLENKPEGTFLLRDSAQSDYQFSVSFRRYCRTMHARIEQLDHMFSFDSHCPGVFKSPSITDLIEHYKVPAKCPFFEPQLSQPLKRQFVFSLKHTCRAVLCRRITYDDVQHFPIPRSLKAYLREYNYKRPVCIRQLDD